MHHSRRTVLKSAGVFGALAGAVAAGLLGPVRALAAWNTGAFEAKNLADALKALGVSNPQQSADIQIRAPEIAENGAVVPVEITSNIPDTTRILVFIEKNPFPYTGSFDVSQGAAPFVQLRVKIGESSPVRAIIAAGGKYYTSAREVKVTIGGCGG
jgi:sulfur-oxidizing protein SoxY